MLPLEELILAIQAGVAVELMVGHLHVAHLASRGHVQFDLGQQSPPASLPPDAEGEVMRQGDGVPPAWSTQDTTSTKGVLSCSMGISVR